MTRLPPETVPTTYYDPAVKGRVTSMLTLDPDRMPTQKGPGGVVADRSKHTVGSTIGLNGKPVPYLMPVYMLCALRRPGARRADVSHFTLSVHDLDFWRQDPSRKDLRPSLPDYPGRFTLDMWDAVPEYETVGDPERDASWEALNPTMGFRLDADTTLIGARAACEVLAGLLARGEAHPDGDRRDYGQAFARQSTLERARHTEAQERIFLRHGEAAARRFAQRVNARGMRALDRREHREHRRVLGLLLRAARQADKAARVQAARAVPPVRRALNAVKR